MSDLLKTCLLLTSSERLRQRKDREEATDVVEGARQGYQDLIQGRTIEFTGDLRAVLREFEAIKD